MHRENTKYLVRTDKRFEHSVQIYVRNRIQILWSTLETHFSKGPFINCLLTWISTQRCEFDQTSRNRGCFCNCRYSGYYSTYAYFTTLNESV